MRAFPHSVYATIAEGIMVRMAQILVGRVHSAHRNRKEVSRADAIVERFLV